MIRFFPSVPQLQGDFCASMCLTPFQILLNYCEPGKIIYLYISDYFEMVQRKKSCCGIQQNDTLPGKEMELPGQIQKELEELGGFEALSDRIPSHQELEEKSRVCHALSDPLRLTILYLIKDQPLCVCVINRFMHLAGSKLSYHLTNLKESGLIEGEYHGNWIIYHITDSGRQVLTCMERMGT